LTGGLEADRQSGTKKIKKKAPAGKRRTDRIASGFKSPADGKRKTRLKKDDKVK